MPTTQKKTNSTSSRSTAAEPAHPAVITMGCPAGVGPEIALQAALTAKRCVVVGDLPSLLAAGRSLKIRESALSKLTSYDPQEGDWSGPRFLQVGSELAARDRRPGKPSQAAGRAQLDFIERGYSLARERGWPLVTGPVSKEVIARSGRASAKKFLGHTEWLQRLDGAQQSVMCFASPRLVTSLVTTHLPLAKVSRQLTPERVCMSTVALADLLLRLGLTRPKIAVCSFNPHAGEGELLGREESRAILPGIEQARRLVGRKAVIQGPVGAETAYRLGAAGGFHGVVGMYHDQATIPMKLVDFGGAVNVTQGLSIVRTSVDHGTAYDIAGKGQASPTGMLAAQQLAERLARSGVKLKAWTESP